MVVSLQRARDALGKQGTDSATKEKQFGGRGAHFGALIGVSWLRSTRTADKQRAFSSPPTKPYGTSMPKARADHHIKNGDWPASAIDPKDRLVRFLNRERVLGLGSSKLAKQNQDQQNNNHKAEAAAAVVASTVKRAAADSAKAAE
jgi:hypothetical protein